MNARKTKGSADDGSKAAAQRHGTRTKVAAAAASMVAAAAAGVAVARVVRRDRPAVLHVAPHGERWEIRLEGNKTPRKIFDTKEEAVAFARGLAHRQLPSELVIHRVDGSEQDRHSYDA